MLLDVPAEILLGILLAILAIAYFAGQALRRQPQSVVNPAIVDTFLYRIRAWWLLYAVLGASFLIPYGRLATVILFGILSFWALREFITLTPTRLGDHRALFWVFFVFTPAQYILVALGQQYFETYSILIPVYGFLFVPTRVALAGDSRRFLERTAKIQAGLLICVYALSHAPALLDLQLIKDGEKWRGGSAGMLLFFLLVVQFGDLSQFLWGKLIGKRVIAPAINSSKTWEGFVASVLTTTLLGGLFWPVTPFNLLEAACMSLVIAVMGFAGSMTMSAIKRDRGVRDYGTLVQGHVGILDRMDSICFAAPVFFHLTRLFFSAA